MATEAIWWCTKHRSGRHLAAGSPAPHTCDKAQAAALRIGADPFYPNRCHIVRAEVVQRREDEDE